MRYRSLGRRGPKVSVIGLGALHFGVFLDEKETSTMVRRAVDLGVTFVETAPMYGEGRSESHLGEAIAGWRDGLVLSTKVGLEPETRPDGSFGVKVSPLTKERIVASVEASARNLRTPVVDLLQLHAFDATVPVEETLSALKGLERDGRIRACGASNYDPRELAAVLDANRAVGATFTSLQCHFNLAERRAATALFPLAADAGLGVICNRALARGILTGKYGADGSIPSNARAATSWRVRRWLEPATLKLVEELAEFSRRRGRTPTELAIAWALSFPEVTTLAIGARTLEQLETCVRGAEWALTAPERAEIERIVGEQGLQAQVEARPDVFLET